MTKNIKEYLSISEAAKKLNWTYHRLLSWIKKDKCGLCSSGYAVKVGWGWALHQDAIPIIKEEEKKSTFKKKKK